MLAFFIQLLLLTLRLLGIFYHELRRWTLSSEQQSKTIKNVHGHHRLSKRIAEIKPSYDIVVIGSGYGGSIAASRMSRASSRQSVCVLERGLERWPGESPETTRAAIPHLRFTGHLFGRFAINVGSPTGLYHWLLGKASSVFVGNGLGGTSLLNAGVWLRPERRVMESESWPEEVRGGGKLDEYFESAERMLEPAICPKDRTVKKFDISKKQAKAVGLEDKTERVPLMTSFEGRINAAGVKMKPSQMTGQDCMGSNDGSKNSTLVTYLADAERWGAEIFCGCEVSRVERHPKDGYLVYYRRLVNDPGLGDDRTTLHWVHAKRFVFFGAGSIGTTEILLRSKEHGLPLSPRAGLGLTSNGSMLAFGYDLNQQVNSIGRPRPSPTKDAPGPTITGQIDCRDTKSVEQGFVIQDGTFPTAMAFLFRLVYWLLPAVKAPGRSWLQTFSRLGRDALDRSQVYLVLGHDNAGGKMTLVDGRPSLDMRSICDFGHLSTARDLLTRMTHAFNGTFKSPGVKVCVHPLGGMGMASDGTGTTGATTHTGEVLTGKGTGIHQGLVVVDGALTPMSLGANPVATIAALAERSMDLLAKREGWEIDLQSFEPQQKSAKTPREEMVVFSEVMEGTLDDHGGQSSIELAMTIQVYRSKDIYEGNVTGTMRCPSLSKDLIDIEKGSFRLFEDDPGISLGRKMSYDLDLVSSTGMRIVFHGEKTIGPAIAFSPRRAWRATTTMTASIKVADANTQSSAQLHISATDLLRQLRSLRVVAPHHTKQRRVLWDFIHHFAANLVTFVFVPFAPLQYPTRESVDPDSNRLTRPVPDTQQMIRARDGCRVPLRMWNPSSQPNGKDILFVPGGAVTHEIYALSTIRKNAIEHFTSLGYRCWTVTHRVATVRAENRKDRWTVYDARWDLEAALRTVREMNENQKVLVVVHCAGSGAFSSGILDGTIPPSWIRGIVASQSFLHPLVSSINKWKARLPLVSLYRKLAGEWFACDSKANDHLIQRILNQVLRFYPHTSRDELCASNVCHRTDLPYGRLWNHANLNSQTHHRLHELFTGTNADCIEHLAQMGLRGAILDRQGHNLVTEENVQRLKGIPVFLMVGGDNQVYQPEATMISYRLLRDKFGSENVRRSVFEGLGHLDCWMSDAAAGPGSVFETVGKELESMG